MKDEKFINWKFGLKVLFFPLVIIYQAIKEFIQLNAIKRKKED